VRSYDVGCQPDKLADLVAMTNYLSRFAPSGGKGVARCFVFRCFRQGRQTSVFEVDWAQHENAPIWRGLADQCRMVANADLFRAMACREMAEELASSREWKAAAHLYADAVQRLVAWDQRKWLVGPAGIVNDNVFARLTVEQALDHQPPEKALEVCRREWSLLWYNVFVPPPGSASEPRPAIWDGRKSREECEGGAHLVHPTTQPSGGEQ
jgi:hypothetical protein